MANLNKVMLIGRLTRDPEAVSFSNGGKVTKFGFAVNNRKLNQQTNQWEDVPVWLDVKVFNRGEFSKLADRAEQTLRRGQQVFIEGHLVLEQWKTPEGQERSKLVIVMDNFQYLEPRGEGGMAGGMGAGSARPARAAASSSRGSGGGMGGGSGGFDGGYDEEPEGLDVPPGRDNEDDIPF